MATTEATTTSCLGINDFNCVYQSCKSVIAKWETLATNLEVHRPKVEEIESSERDPAKCFHKVLSAWLKVSSTTQPKPSWRSLCDALAGMGEVALSERIQREHPCGCGLCKVTATNTVTTISVKQSNIGIPVNSQNSRGTLLTKAVYIQIDDTRSLATELKKLFEKLIDFFTLEIRHLDMDTLRLHISKHFISEEDIVDDTIEQHLSKIEHYDTPNAVLNYLVRSNFIGYINYFLVKVFQKPAKSSLLDKRIEEYEKNYHYFLEVTTLMDFRDTFQQYPDLRPDYPAGIPKFEIHLESEWDSKSVFEFKKFLKQCFNNSDCIDQLMIAKISRSCVIITFAVLPHIIRTVLHYLTNDDVISTLKKEGITVNISKQLMKHHLVHSSEQSGKVSRGKPQLIKGRNVYLSKIAVILAQLKQELGSKPLTPEPKQSDEHQRKDESHSTSGKIEKFKNKMDELLAMLQRHEADLSTATLEQKKNEALQETIQEKEIEKGWSALKSIQEQLKDEEAKLVEELEMTKMGEKQYRQDNVKLHTTIKQLQILLHDHNIPLPTNFESTDSDVQLESVFGPSTKEFEIPGDEKLKEALQLSNGVVAVKSLDDDDWLPEEPVKRKPIDSFLQPTDVQEVTLNEGHDDYDETLFTVSPGFMEQYKKFKEKAEQLKMKETMMKGYLLELEQHRAEKKITSGEILKLRDEKMSFESKIKELEEAREQATANIRTLDNYKSRVPMLYDDGSHHYPPVDIRMSHFHQRRTRREYWYSPSFYSHPRGYKLCISLAPAGQDKRERTHLSMFVHVMSGDHDATLPWPFRGVITIQLRNKRGDHTHIEAKVQYDESASKEASNRVINGFRTASGTASLRGVGEAKFISYEDLVCSDSAKMTEYLKDDEVIIRVTEVTINQQMVLPTRSLGGAEPIPSIEYIAELIVPNFTKLKDKNQKWESPPFYTRPNNTGYKFLLAVHANGKGKSKGTWVSIYTHLMRGEHDDELKFPFRGVITVQLDNQRWTRDHVVSHIQYTVESDPTGKRGGRVNLISAANLVAGRSYGGWGYPTFVRHEHLTPYLTNNDELVFRITNVEDFSLQELLK